MSIVLRLASCLAVAVALTGTALAQSSTAEVRDEAGLFHPDVVAQMNERIKEIQRIYHRDLLVETVKTIPGDELTLLEKEKTRARAVAAFGAWTRRLAEQHNVNGVYVLISTDTHFRTVSVLARPEDPGAGLGPHPVAICNEIRREFLDREKRAGPNSALKELVERVESRFSANLTEERVAASSLSWTTIVLIILGILVLWLIASVVRMKLAGKPAPGEAGADPGQHQARPGVLGGMFGSVAGQWIYDEALQKETKANGTPAQPKSVAETGFPLSLQNDKTDKPKDDRDEDAVPETGHDSTLDQ